jgi:hypothetical protein
LSNGFIAGGADSTGIKDALAGELGRGSEASGAFLSFSTAMPAHHSQALTVATFRAGLTGGSNGPTSSGPATVGKAGPVLATVGSCFGTTGPVVVWTTGETGRGPFVFSATLDSIGVCAAPGFTGGALTGVRTAAGVAAAFGWAWAAIDAVCLFRAR